MRLDKIIIFFQILFCFCSANSAGQRNKRETSQKPQGMRGSCGGQHFGMSGYIASPNFPSLYPSRSNCTWNIRVPTRYVVKTTFRYVNMEDAPIQKLGDCGADSIAITDKANPNKLVGGQKFCGYDTMFNPVFSETNHIIVKFISDATVEYDGFVLHWMAIKPPVNTFNCNFEHTNGMCNGWEQDKKDDFDWSFRKGPTPSGKRVNTGPKVDHTLGNNLGTYAYVEASGKKSNQQAILTTAKSKHLNILQKYCLRFWYNMHGDGMGSLLAYIIQRNESARLIFSMHGDQGSPWHLSAIPIYGQGKTIQIRFVGVRGNNFKSDMAIDDIVYSKKRCPQPLTTSSVITTTMTTIKTVKPTTKSFSTTTPVMLTTASYFFGFTTRAACPADEYQCRTSNNCISLAWFCDGTQDCQENEDEENCNGGTTSTTICQPWSNWSECSKSCGTGARSKKQVCLAGLESETASVNEETCNTYPCPAWSTWGKWPNCDASCNGGHKIRWRTCLNVINGSESCKGPSTQLVNCNGQNCPKWGDWSAFSTCTVTCGPGNVTRTRVCLNGETGKKGCRGPMFERKTCNEAITNHSICEKMQCYEGMTTVFNEVTIANDLKIRTCTQVQKQGFSNHFNNSMSCGLISYNVLFMGRQMLVKQGTCVPTIQCENFNCAEMKTALKLYDVVSCQAQCCDEPLCNYPNSLNLNEELPNSCAINPCLNGGSCQPTGNAKYVCYCSTGFAGKHCEKAETIQCFTGFSSRLTPEPTSLNLVRATCPDSQSICQITSVQAIILGQTVYMDILQCSSQSACNERTCATVKNTISNGNVTKCNVKCCEENLCNVLEVKNITEPITATSMTTEPTTPAPMVCARRNLPLARRRSRTCKPYCLSDSQCSSPLKCLCDGPCGKTCSHPALSLGLQVKCSRGLKVGSKCVFSCASNMKLKGLPNLNCQSTAQWDKPDIPTCTKQTIQCPKRNLPLARRRDRNCADSCTNDEQCNNGKSCNCDGSCGKTCSFSNITCPMLQMRTSNIEMKCTNNNNVGSKCSFKCRRTYKLVGFPNFNCQSDAKWDKTTQPSCLKNNNNKMTCRKNREAHDKCCGRQSYNSKLILCCNGQRSKMQNGKNACCSARPYNTQIRGCCSKALFNLKTHECCGGNLISKNSAEKCCNGKLYQTSAYRCDPKFGGRLIPIATDQEEEEE